MIHNYVRKVLQKWGKRRGKKEISDLWYASAVFLQTKNSFPEEPNGEEIVAIWKILWKS